MKEADVKALMTRVKNWNHVARQYGIVRGALYGDMSREDGLAALNVIRDAMADLRNSERCDCESCVASRAYQYGGLRCCPRKLSHGMNCICGATVLGGAA